MNTKLFLDIFRYVINKSRISLRDKYNYKGIRHFSLKFIQILMGRPYNALL